MQGFASRLLHIPKRIIQENPKKEVGFVQIYLRKSKRPKYHKNTKRICPELNCEQK